MQTSNSRSSFGKFYKIVLAVFGFVALALGVMTSGFTVWDRFKSQPSTPVVPAVQPVVNITLEPIRINYNSGIEDSKKTVIDGKIETGDGVYRFIDSATIELKLLDSNYFYWQTTKEIFDLKKVQFEKMIMKESASEQKIRLDLDERFTLEPKKTIELYLAKTDKLVAHMTVHFPFDFNGTRHDLPVTIPVYVYYRSY